MRETAFAKINLALHVRQRRADGYHELETLFAFVDSGDVLVVAPSNWDELRTVGEFGYELADPYDNIVMKALSILPREKGWAVTLEKNLPVAAGLGGGSADAGAVFRIVESSCGLPDDWMARAAKLGADVPACVLSRTHIGRGIGTEQEPVENDLSGTPVLLVNPRVPVLTGPVFKGWDGVDRGGLPAGTAREIALAGRNDLRASAAALCPAIAEVLVRLKITSAWKADMSGSGATCFALYDSVNRRDAAAAAIRHFRPGWWTLTGKLR